MGPWGYTVDAKTRTLADTWTPTSGTAYDLSVYGANGFFRRFAGGLTTSSANLSVQMIEDGIGNTVAFTITNVGEASTTVTVTDTYTGRAQRYDLRRGETARATQSLEGSGRWYDAMITDSSDPSFVRHYAGHVENGEDSVSDPLIGRGVA